MLQKLISASLIGTAVFLGTASATEPAFNFVKIDYPGAQWTQLEGIGPGGEIAGIYTDASGVFHGFVLRQGRHRGDEPEGTRTGDNQHGDRAHEGEREPWGFTSIDYPGAAYTDVRAVTPAGDILGNYALPGENASLAVLPGGAPLNIHGFVLKRDGALIPLVYPGHPNMIAQRILPDGSIMGCIHDHDYMASMRGFVWNHGVWTALDGSLDGLNVPDSMNNGATPDLGLIAGLFTDLTSNKTHGYVIQNGTFTAFDYPGALSTRAWDMNPSGAIVGDYTDPTGAHGFLLENGSFASLTFPGATATKARGINPGGVVVGWYQDAAGTHGFLAVPLPNHGQ